MNECLIARTLLCVYRARCIVALLFDKTGRYSYLLL